ncbi:MAG: ATP-dependent helicase, partial [Acaryochloridaceae cyanobacterium RL_2_7]|nr:ATP-dependent helicase [Acaryochloridaceae cyanobacterium RL_2_7]
ELVEKLEARGYSTAALSGDIKQNLREKIVERLKKGSLDIVVATDVAARGLDVERISHVVNYDIPYDNETYVHRIGRTGRAGRSGNAILFVSPREKRMLRSIERATRQPIEPMQLPSHADIADRRIVQFKEKITETLEDQDLAFFKGLINSYQKETGASPEDIAAALAFLVQLDRPLLPLSPKSVRKEKDKDKADRKPVDQNMKMESYRLEVGSEIGVKPKNIVGAIANEAGLESGYIQDIQIYDHHTTLDLPEGMPQDILKHLRKVKIFGEPLKITRVKRSAKPVGKRKRKADQRENSRRQMDEEMGPTKRKRLNKSRKHPVTVE